MTSVSSYSNIILHVPHSGTEVPYPLNRRPLAYHVPRMYDATSEIQSFARPFIDYYTDELFVPGEPNGHIHSLIFPYNRAVCDVERLPHDPMEEKGFGIMYDFFPKLWPLTKNSCRRTAYELYLQHQHSLESLIAKVSFENTPLLIDCHSFSALPNALCSNPGDVDICIGYNEDWSKPSDGVIATIRKHFEQKGYKVGINTPFANSKTVDIPFKYHSVMIEVCKRLYMDEESLAKNDGFERLKQDIRSLYDKLIS